MKELVHMGKYVFAYRGGGMAGTPEEQEAAMAAWGAWFGSLGAAVVDRPAHRGIRHLTVPATKRMGRLHTP